MWAGVAWEEIIEGEISSCHLIPFKWFTCMNRKARMSLSKQTTHCRSFTSRSSKAHNKEYNSALIWLVLMWVLYYLMEIKLHIYACIVATDPWLVWTWWWESMQEVWSTPAGGRDRPAVQRRRSGGDINGRKDWDIRWAISIWPIDSVAAYAATAPPVQHAEEMHAYACSLVVSS
jgi:hypothetical protein